YVGPSITPGAATPTSLGGFGDNTEIYLAASDDGGLTWTALGKQNQVVQINGDVGGALGFRNTLQDGFSGANTDPSVNPFPAGRAQYQPALAVDPVSGTLVAAYFDASYDASRGRVGRSVQMSIDGGLTFSDSAFLNAPEQVVDLAT